MNRLEFKETLKALDVNNHLLNMLGRSVESETVHFWNNVAMYFGGLYYG